MSFFCPPLPYWQTPRKTSFFSSGFHILNRLEIAEEQMKGEDHASLEKGAYAYIGFAPTYAFCHPRRRESTSNGTGDIHRTRRGRRKGDRYKGIR